MSVREAGSPDNTCCGCGKHRTERVARDFLGNEFKITPSRDGAATYTHHYAGVCNGLGTRTEPGTAQPYNALAGHRITGGISVLARDGARNEASHREADWAWTDAIVIRRARR